MLFFPFSSFEVKEINEIIKEKEYEIKLLYLGKYLKDIENDKNICKNGIEIPDSEFKKQLCDFGLIKKTEIQKINTSKLYKSFKKYEIEIKENSKNKKTDIKTNVKIDIDENDDNLLQIISKVNYNNEFNNIIVGVINICKDDVHKEIQIINSYENAKYDEECVHYSSDFDGEDSYTSYEEWKNEEDKNEIEIKYDILIIINGKKIDFTYQYKFEKEGKYIIEYHCKNQFNRLNHMFYKCSNLTKLDLSNFNSQNIVNMREMFYGCSSLTYLNLSYFNIQKDIKMDDIFEGCISLKKKNIITKDNKILEKLI